MSAKFGLRRSICNRRPRSPFPKDIPPWPAICIHPWGYRPAHRRNSRRHRPGESPAVYILERRNQSSRGDASKTENAGDGLLVDRHVERISHQDVVERRPGCVEARKTRSKCPRCAEIAFSTQAGREERREHPRGNHVRISRLVQIDASRQLRNRQKRHFFQSDESRLDIAGILRQDRTIARPPLRRVNGPLVTIQPGSVQLFSFPRPRAASTACLGTGRGSDMKQAKESRGRTQIYLQGEFIQRAHGQLLGQHHRCVYLPRILNAIEQMSVRSCRGRIKHTVPRIHDVVGSNWGAVGPPDRNANWRSCVPARKVNRKSSVEVIVSEGVGVVKGHAPRARVASQE